MLQALMSLPWLASHESCWQAGHRPSRVHWTEPKLFSAAFTRPPVCTKALALASIHFFCPREVAGLRGWEGLPIPSALYRLEFAAL